MEIAHKGKATEFLKKLPAAPRWFSREAKTAYAKYGKILIAAGILKSRHIPTLEIMAQNYAQWEAAVKAINRANRKKAMSGYIQKFTTGATNVSPEITLKEKAEKQIFICLKRFGLDPKSEKELSNGNQLTLPLSLDGILGAAK